MEKIWRSVDLFELLRQSCICSKYSSSLDFVFAYRTWQSEADFCGRGERQRQLVYKRR